MNWHNNKEPLRRDVMKTLSAAIDLSEAVLNHAPIKKYYDNLLKENKKLFNNTSL